MTEKPWLTVVEAAAEQGQEGHAHFLLEAADLVYHLMVMLRHKGATLSEVEAELQSRLGVSGLDEKKTRSDG